ncbi:hypothetical protein HXA31_10060 [Salipaludibacillus agaradhaerens]|uniref:Lipoprotein n=1 Tax=Salipaludibacillus agaradhaerens TaxID=76935 RepID=A0A9Q4AZQ0_SALAG|nr:hypothetical protein [Salipaludibacillus agaradhaerens]MCR6095721.1 hypothetical protein [Salipaludibacillus agaradhaerens]MCR6114719.1 hypothetical protein [Salipaludibacillus agaradhaerens]
MKQFLILSLLLVLTTTGCTTERLNNTTSLPEITSIEKMPVKMAFHSSQNKDNFTEIAFKLEHVDDSAINSEDYQLQWPKYILDNEEIAYKVEDVKMSENSLDDEPLNDHELGFTLRLSPAVMKERDKVMLQIPVYVIPRLFEEGYPFNVREPHVDRIVTGDLVIEDLKLEDRVIEFNLIDKHPDHQEQDLSYLFSRVQDNESIYPLFSTIESGSGSSYVKLEFAQSISLPARFSVERTTIEIPEWRFPFSIPVNLE